MKVKVVIYVYHVHPNVATVLAHYASLGFVDVLPYSMAGENPNTDPYTMSLFFEKSRHFPLYQHFEHIVRHDCYYRWGCYGLLLEDR